MALNDFTLEWCKSYLIENYAPTTLTEKELVVWNWLVGIFKETVNCRVSDADVHLMEMYCRAKVATDEADAEFVLKYKNIERTETLDLPTWEEAEIDELVKSGKSKNGCWNLIKGFTDKKNNEMFEFSLSSDDDNQFYLSVNNEDSSYKDLFYKPLTYENYLEACELCKKLFEGEV